jgi:hypothetical protein
MNVPLSRLIELGASRNVCPLELVTMTSRMFPLLSVTTWLTWPMDVPLLLTMLVPFVSPGSVVDGTAPRARTLFGLA